MPKLNLNMFGRIVFPGVAIILFLFWKQGWPLFLEPGLFGFFIGLIVYPFYRATYFLLMRWLLSKTFKIPQYDFHNSLVDSLQLSPKLKTIWKASACASNVLQKKAPDNFLKELAIFNMFVHILYMTSLLSIGAIVYSLYPLQAQEVVLWLIVFLVTSIAGLLLDHFQADPRETLFLKQYQKDYEEALKTL